MRVDVVYRTIERANGRLLRMRIRREDGSSAILMAPGPLELETHLQRAGLPDAVLNAVEDDLAVVANMRENTHWRKALEIAPEDLARIGVTEWHPPRQFNLSYGKPSHGQLRLTARESNPLSGTQSLNVSITFAQPEFEAVLRQVELEPKDIRDENLYGTRSKRLIDEDEVELLFDALEH